VEQVRTRKFYLINSVREWRDTTRAAIRRIEAMRNEEKGKGQRKKEREEAKSCQEERECERERERKCRKSEELIEVRKGAKR